MFGAWQGLGKTLQTIAFLAHMQTVRGVAGPSLVVVPMSVLSSWTREFQRWAPSLRVVRLHSSSPDDKLRIRREVCKLSLFIFVALATPEAASNTYPTFWLFPSIPTSAAWG